MCALSRHIRDSCVSLSISPSYKDTERKWPCTIQDLYYQKLTILAPLSCTSGLQKCEKINFCFSKSPSILFFYGSPVWTKTTCCTYIIIIRKFLSASAHVCTHKYVKIGTVNNKREGGKVVNILHKYNFSLPYSLRWWLWYLSRL